MIEVLSSLGKKFGRPHLNPQLGAVACDCYPQLLREAQIENCVPDCQGHKVRSNLKNNQHKKELVG
jgi:hypothetical protein